MVVVEGSLDLPVGPWLAELGQTMFDGEQKTEPVEGVATEARGGPLPVQRPIGELEVVEGPAVLSGLRAQDVG